jgi:hypothetical protein
MARPGFSSHYKTSLRDGYAQDATLGRSFKLLKQFRRYAFWMGGTVENTLALIACQYFSLLFVILLSSAVKVAARIKS